MAGWFELKKTKDNKFAFNLKAGNGEIILTSETYSTKSAAQNGIDSVKANASADERFERKVATNGQHYFALHAANKEPIGKSELYTSKAAMENGIASVKSNAPTAPVKDLAA